MELGINMKTLETTDNTKVTVQRSNEEAILLLFKVGSWKIIVADFQRI